MGDYTFPPVVTERRIRQVKCRGGCNLTAPAFCFGESWGLHATQNHVAFRGMPTPEVGEAPCIQHPSFRRGNCTS